MILRVSYFRAKATTPHRVRSRARYLPGGLRAIQLLTIPLFRPFSRAVLDAQFLERLCHLPAVWAHARARRVVEHVPVTVAPFSVIRSAPPPGHGGGRRAARDGARADDRAAARKDPEIALKFLERRHPERWRPKTALEHTGPGGGPVEHRIVWDMGPRPIDVIGSLAFLRDLTFVASEHDLLLRRTCSRAPPANAAAAADGRPERSAPADARRAGAALLRSAGTWRGQARRRARRPRRGVDRLGRYALAVLVRVRLRVLDLDPDAVRRALKRRDRAAA
jgi:hypothetical protein